MPGMGVPSRLGRYVVRRRLGSGGFATVWLAYDEQLDAEDAAQEALLNIATKIHTYSGRSSFSTWVHSVAANSARSTYRKLKRSAQAASTADRPDKPDPRTTSVIAGTRLDLLEALETLERDRPQMVTPLVLRDVYGLSYEEIAAEVGAPLGTVKSRIHDARELVRPLLRPKD